MSSRHQFTPQSRPRLVLNALADEQASSAAQQRASALGVPLAYLYADTSDLAEVILAFGLLPEAEQHRLAVELKARVSAAPPAAARGRKRAGRIKA